MTWLTWRLQRAELLLLGALALALGGALAASRADVVALSKIYTAETCPVPLAGTEGACIIPVSAVYRVVSTLMPWLNFLPLIAALLLALPLVTELDQGSYRLAWTQGITRKQWARVKIGLLVLGALIFATLLAVGFHWWNSPRDALNGRLNGDAYDFRGTLPIGHMLFAIGLTLAIGVVVKRPVPALGLASVAYVGLRIPFMEWARPRLVTPVTQPEADYHMASAGNIWWLGSFWQDASGHRISEQAFYEMCAPSPFEMSRGAFERCIADHGLTHYITYHPESHYWPLQLIETGLYLAAGLALIGFAAWYLMRRVE